MMIIIEEPLLLSNTMTGDPVSTAETSVMTDNTDESLCEVASQVLLQEDDIL